MGSAWVRRVASLALLAGWAVAALGFARWPGAVGPTGIRPEARVLRSPFHAYDRARIEEPGGYCTRCHPAAAHGRDGRLRAFWNLHRVGLDCGVCHLSGPRLVPGRADGRVFLGVRGPEGWRPVDRPGPDARFRVRGPGCTECHRRGSPWLAGPSLYDPYRRRLLEDLAVLRWLEGGR
ncbi:hypothetical protein [Deferrisoma sp.]